MMRLISLRKLGVLLALVILITGNIAHALPSTADITVLVNVKHPLTPKEYVPADLVTVRPGYVGGAYPDNLLRRPTVDALYRMIDAARRDGIELRLASGYRSYISQAYLYYSSLYYGGIAESDLVAQPGASEHQTGLAADLISADNFCAVQTCFIMSRSARWLSANAHSYGFIQRYPQGAEQITGIGFEPWHYRYVGTKLAAKLFNSHQTLEQYYDVVPSGAYWYQLQF